MLFHLATKHVLFRIDIVEILILRDNYSIYMDNCFFFDFCNFLLVMIGYRLQMGVVVFVKQKNFFFNIYYEMKPFQKERKIKRKHINVITVIHTERPFQCFGWCSNNGQRWSLFTTASKTSTGCFHFGHNAGIIVEQWSLIDRCITTYWLCLFFFLIFCQHFHNIFVIFFYKDENKNEFFTDKHHKHYNSQHQKKNINCFIIKKNNNNRISWQYREKSLKCDK